MKKKLLLPLLGVLTPFLVDAQTTATWSRDTGSTGSGSKVVTVTDNYGNICVAGTVGSGTAADWKILKYNPVGELLWEMTYNGTGSGSDVVADIKTDMSRNIYVCGTSQGSSNSDIVVRKINESGSAVWTNAYTNGSSYYDEASAMHVTESGAVYVTGSTKASSSGTYDYLTFSITSSGSANWSATYNGSGSLDDISTAITVDGSGNVYVTGRASNSTDFDIVTRCYSSTGTAVWTKTYNGAGSSNKNDKGTCIALESSGTYVYVGGEKGIKTTNTDYVLHKYATSNGNASWTATYDGANSRLDVLNDLVVDGSGNIYVTGSSEDLAGDDDYATICYNSSGTAQWTQRYDGPGATSDKAYAIVLDGSHVVVTGQSLGSGSAGIDFATLSYACSGGTSNWTMRYNGAYSGNDYGSDVTIDNMGKVIVAGSVQTGSSTYEIGTISYFQAEKNSNAITSNLERLSKGLTDVAALSGARDLMYDLLTAATEDSSWVVKYGDFVLLADGQSLNATSLINSKISSVYGVSSSYDWADIYRKQLWAEKEQLTALIGTPYFDGFTYSAYTSSTPNLAYDYAYGNYPISCHNCSGSSTLSSSGAQSTASWLTLIALPAPIGLSKSFGYNSCVPTIASLANPDDLCQVCPAYSSTTLVNNNSGGTQNHEIGIELGFDYSYAVCQDLIDINSNDGMSVSFDGGFYYDYANISAVGGIYWDRTSPSVDHEYVKKTTNRPIVDRGYASPYTVSNCTSPYYSNSMSLCRVNNYFNDQDECVVRYGLYYGLYRVSRPGISGMPPVYFSFSYAKGLTFYTNPDMNIHYGSTQTGSTCSPSNKPQLTPDIYVINSCFEDAIGNVFNMTTPMDVVATTDYSTFTNFWLDNAITVGFTYNNTGDCDNNVLTFTANTSGSSCNPNVDYPTHGALIGQLTLNSSGEYETMDRFASNAAYSSGTTLLVHVVANFTNGEAINECQTITLANTPVGGSSLNLINSLIRGNISNYSSSITNYQVDIYLY